MKHALRRGLIGAALLGLSPLAALAQGVVIPTPNISVSQGMVTERPGATLITLAAVGPSTVNSADQAGFGKNVTCAYNGTAHTGTPANVVNIQGKVPGTTSYYTILASASIATDIASIVSVGTGTATLASTGTNPVLAAQQMPIPAQWRVQVVLGTGTTPTTTATVNCTLSD
jgi:hypothetical protein